MKQILTAFQILRRDGLDSLLRNRKVAPYGRKILGKELFQQLIGHRKLGYWPRIRSPRTFNEKITHRMIYHDRPLYTKIYNKETCRDYVKDRIGDHVLPDVYHITDNPQTIPFGSLPRSFVIKPTLGSGNVIIVDGEENADQTGIKNKCKKWLSKDYRTDRVLSSGHYWLNDFEPSIMVEERLEDEAYDIPLDYKFYVFHGQVEYVHVDFARFGAQSRRFFDRDWNAQDFQKGNLPLGPKIGKPRRYEDMIDIAETLGEDFDFIRTDLYNLNDERIVFGELTVAPASGRSPFTPQEWDFEFGELW